MRPYTLDFDDAFWADVLTRIEPIVGDVRQRFGERWIDPVATCFARTDWWAVQVAAKNNGKAPSWYVLEWHEGAFEITRDDDYIVAGESRAECLAHLADRCTLEGVWPTSLTYQESSDRTSFTLGEIPFAVIRPVASPGPVDDRKRSRVESTLLGLGQTNVSLYEFDYRFAKWPGVENVRSDAYRLHSKADFHWPCPSEWLASARQLLVEAGLPDSGTAQAQALVAAAFGFKTWNHLCGLIPSGSHKSAWWSMCSPYYVHQEDASDHATIRVYHDAVEGFLDFHSHAVRACENRGEAAICYSRSLIGLPYISLKTVPIESANQWVLPRQDTLASLMPVNSVEFEEDTLARVCDETRDGYVDGLRRLFMIDEPISTKRDYRAAKRGHDEIAFDGPWHFYVDGAHVFAELYSADGRKIGSAGVPRYKGALLWDSQLGVFILTADYGGREPLAILKGLSPATIAELRKALPASEYEQWMYRPASNAPDEGNSLFAREHEYKIARLLKSMTDAGSVGC